MGLPVRQAMMSIAPVRNSFLGGASRGLRTVADVARVGGKAIGYVGFAALKATVGRQVYGRQAVGLSCGTSC